MERERPVGVLFVVTLEIVLAIAFVAGALGQSIPMLSGGLLQLTNTELGRAVVLGFAAAYFFGAVGMILGKRWGWALSMVLTGAALVVSLVAYANGDFHAIRLALGVALAFYLNQRSVRDYFLDRGAPVVTPQT